MADHRTRHILITGGSSGIGEALALAYAAPGITLSLTGRNAQRLAAVGDACAKRGATVDRVALDVTNAEAVAGWIAARDAAAPLDLVIANAGVSSSTDASATDQTRRMPGDQYHDWRGEYCLCRQSPSCGHGAGDRSRS